jgi:hypothetical protein
MRAEPCAELRQAARARGVVDGVGLEGHGRAVRGPQAHLRMGEGNTVGLRIMKV